MSGSQNISAASFVLPPQMIGEWKEEDYIRSIRSIVNNWNFNIYQYNPNAIDSKEIGLPLRFADRCFWWSEYYFGRQRNIDFDSMLLRADGRRRPLKMFRGKDIKKFVDDQVGSVAQTIKNLPDILDAVGSSENIVSARKTQLDIKKFLTDTRVAQNITQILAPYGMYLETVGGKKAVDRAKEQMDSMDYVESLESAAVNIGKDFLYRNYWDEQFLEVAKSAYITGLGCAKISVVNGYPLLEQFPAYEAIVPPRNTGDQHRTDAFGGRVRFMTVADIAATYPELGREKMKEIEDMAYTDNQAIWNDCNITFNIGSSVMWWSVKDGVPRVGVADVQWASYDGKEGQEFKQKTRQGVLIGNKYLIREGLATNQTQEWRNPSYTQFDFLFVRPMSVFGHNMGIPETIYTYVNQIDAWQTKINDWIARAKGNTYILKTKDLPEGVDAATIISDLADDGITVIEGIDIDAGKSDNMIEQVSFDLPASVIGLIGQINQYRLMMADILNIPDTSRGQIKGYQPTKNIEASVVNSSKGTSTFTIPLNTYFTRLVQKGVDKFVTATLDNPNIEYMLIVGDTQMEQLKSTKDLSISRFGITLKYDDLLDEQRRSQIESVVFAYAQNSQQTGYTWTDLFTVQSLTTESEIRSYLEYRDAQIEQKRAAAAQQANELAAAQTERMAQSQEQQTAMREENQNARTAAEIESKEKTRSAEMIHETINSSRDSQQA